MTPFYEEAGITIYHGDCREVLPLLEIADLLLTDPPYGIHSGPVRNGFMADRQGQDAANWDTVPSDEDLQLISLHARQTVMWGFGYFAGALGRCVAPLVWDKGTGANYFADGELAWTSFPTGTLRLFRHQWCGHFKASERDQSSVHPTQKPIALMRWCIEQADKHGPAALVVDPYMGSGTTLIAAQQLGRKAIGVELEERYCEIAVQRLAQGVLEFG